VCAGIKACEGVLSHKDTNHNDISFARADTPTGISGTIQELGEHKSTRLEFRGGGENRNDYSEGSNRVPPNRNIIEVLEEMNPKGVDKAYIYLQSERVLREKEGNLPRRTLGD